MAHAVHEAGADPEAMFEVLGQRKFRVVEGTFEGDDLQAAFRAADPGVDLRRWFFDEPIYDSERTWVVSNQWGRNTVPALEELVALVPDAGISFEPA